MFASALRLRGVCSILLSSPLSHSYHHHVELRSILPLLLLFTFDLITLLLLLPLASKLSLLHIYPASELLAPLLITAVDPFSLPHLTSSYFMFRSYTPTCSAGAASRVPNLTGSFVDEGYLELVELLPTEADRSSQVYHAFDTTTQISYAVKCMRNATPGSPRAADLQRELEIHRSIANQRGLITLNFSFVDNPPAGGAGGQRIYPPGAEPGGGRPQQLDLEPPNVRRPPGARRGGLFAAG
ncbi:hypothetical protein B0H14DRAFT_719598 [Mycena olivaceomarginata]|nr:hypothetical protein B0H14DRAFT_719598 [Mycena olivaceomarginata]